MANQTNDVKAEEIRLPNPFQPFDLKIDVNDENEHYARFVIDLSKEDSASPLATPFAASCLAPFQEPASSRFRSKASVMNSPPSQALKKM